MYTIEFHVCILIIMSKNVLLTLSVEKKMKNKTHHYDFPSSQNGTFGGRKKERGREGGSVRGSRKSTPFGLLI